MKIKKYLSVLVASIMVFGNNVWSYAAEDNFTQTQEYQVIESQKQQMLDSVNVSSRAYSVTNPMGISDIDPYSNPATDNWLTQEIASQIGKSDISQLTQEDFNKITTIYSPSNNIEQIPKEIGNLYNLTTLYLPDNQIKELPAEIGNLSQLGLLDVQQNEIETILFDFSNFSKLQSLVLASNHIKSIPSGLGAMNQLKTLTFSYNEIDKVPAEIGNLSNLNILGLSNNNLSSLPAEIYNLINLQQLYLSDQNVQLALEYIPKDDTFNMVNPIKVGSNFADITNITNGGTYNSSNNTISWVTSEEAREESFNFSLQVYIGNTNALFSGTAVLPTDLEVPLGLYFSDDSVNKHIYTNNMLNVQINLSGTGNYYALDTLIEYDSDLLELKGYSIKNGLKDYYVSSQESDLRFIIASQGKQNPINSSVSDIVYLSFAPKKAGVANITIKQGQAANLEREVNVGNLGTMTVTIESPLLPPNDVNRDGKFTLIDLAIDAYYYGINTIDTDTTKYDADVIPDGRIDDADLQQIVKLILTENK